MLTGIISPWKNNKLCIQGVKHNILKIFLIVLFFWIVSNMPILKIAWKSIRAFFPIILLTEQQPIKDENIPVAIWLR